MRGKPPLKFAKPSPRSGVCLPISPGSHGGGKKGRSGRPPMEFKNWCTLNLHDESIRDVLVARAKAGDLAVAEFFAKYSIPLPKQSIEVSGAPHIIEVHPQKT